LTRTRSVVMVLIIVILFACPFFYSPLAPPSVRGLPDVVPTWNIQQVGADGFWNATNYRGEGIKIAIIDSGVNYTIPDLHDNYLGGWNFVENNSDPMDDYGHGTWCASIAVGMGKHNYVGVAPNAKYFALRVKGLNTTMDWGRVIEAIYWAVNNSADVISMSFGGWFTKYPPDPTTRLYLEIACYNAFMKNITLVAASGQNPFGEGYNYPSYPAGFGPVISVGACDQDLNIPPWCDSGNDLVAPGVDVPLLGLNGSIELRSGTSMACPHVAGAIALLKSRFGKWWNGNYSSDEVRQILKISAAPLPAYSEWRQGAGLLNCTNMIRQRAFMYNAGFEMGGLSATYPWNQAHNGNIGYEWYVYENNYNFTNEYYTDLDGDCHLKMKLNSTVASQPDVYLDSYYLYSAFSVQTNEWGKNATRGVSGIFEATDVTVGSCDQAKVSIGVTFYDSSSGTAKHIEYCWYARGSDTNATDTVYYSMENLATNTRYSFSRDVRSDFYHAFDFQLNGDWQIVMIQIVLEVNNTSSYDSLAILVGETRLYGNYQNVKFNHGYTDINNDEKVSGLDVAIAAHAFGSSPGSANWDPRADVNQNLWNDGTDIALISRDVGS